MKNLQDLREVCEAECTSLESARGQRQALRSLLKSPKGNHKDSKRKERDPTFRNLSDTRTWTFRRSRFGPALDTGDALATANTATCMLRERGCQDKVETFVYPPIEDVTPPLVSSTRSD